MPVFVPLVGRSVGLTVIEGEMVMTVDKAWRDDALSTFNACGTACIAIAANALDRASCGDEHLSTNKHLSGGEDIAHQQRAVVCARVGHLAGIVSRGGQRRTSGDRGLSK